MTTVTTTIDSQAAGEPIRSGDPESGASLEKVRELLFGLQMRDYDRRFARLEERIAKETSDLREDVKKRIAAIEAAMQREVESLSDRLTHLDDQVARGLRDARQQLHDQEQRLIEELRLQADEIIARLVRESHELRTDKADRAGLAALFTEMAMRLNDQFRLPAAQDSPRD